MTVLNARRIVDVLPAIMTPVSKNPICLAQAWWSSAGVHHLARIDNIRFTGSDSAADKLPRGLPKGRGFGELGCEGSSL